MPGPSIFSAFGVIGQIPNAIVIESYFTPIDTKFHSPILKLLSWKQCPHKLYFFIGLLQQPTSNLNGAQFEFRWRRYNGDGSQATWG